MSLRTLPEIQAFEAPGGLDFELPEEALNGFDGAVQAAETDDATITLYGIVGHDPLTGQDNSERRIAAALRAIGDRDVVVNINSPGGNFFAGVAIYNLLRLHPARVTAQVVGRADSAASLIAMAGDDVLMADGAFMLLHRASVLALGNRYHMADAADVLAEIDAAMADIYAGQARVDTKIAAAWIDRRRGEGTLFGAKAAIEAGLATDRLDARAVTVTACNALPPERVVERALRAGGLSASAAKQMISELKGARDAALNVTRDADAIVAAITRCRTTLKT